MARTDNSGLLSFEQLRDLKDNLRGPLTKKRVLIPLGPQAFLPGHLDPLHTEDDGCGNHQTEIVSVVTEDGRKVEMSRKEAMAHLQSEMDRLRPKKQPGTVAAKTSSQSPLSTRSSKSAKESQSGMYVASQPEQLPLFEIREELNDEGQEVKSEAINVTQQLQEWEEQVKRAKAESQRAASPLPTNPAGNGAAIIQEDDSADSDTVTAEVDAAISLSDKEYDALAARLDELARLEESEEQEGREKSAQQKTGVRDRLESAKIGKKQTSSGWAKGFLNKKPTTKNPVGAKKSSPTQPVSSQSGRKVGFSADTQVQEIPRVGERSIRDIPKPNSNNRTKNGGDDGGLFAGAVLERKAPQRRKKAASGPSAPPIATGKTERPLSRFAQQRQQLGST